MKTHAPSRSRNAGNALIITMIMTLAALVTVAGIMSWSSGTARMTGRSNQYSRSVAAAEAGTEKVLSQLNSDFVSGGEALVIANLASYRQIVPTSADSTYWTNWQFQDPAGSVGSTALNSISVSNFSVLTGNYAGLYGFISTYDIISDATEITNLQRVVAGVLQEIQLIRIPVFEFGMYSSDDMEIGCGKLFTVDGPVHANGSLYVEPDNVMVFGAAVSAGQSIFFAREPLDSRGAPVGSVVYMMGATSNAATLTLPIGTTNTSAAIQQIIQPPPNGEDPTSALGRVRYYNQVDMLITVSASGVSATSGRFNSFVTTIPSNQLALFLTTTNSFYDARQLKTVLPLDLNVGKLTTWSRTNQNLRPALGSRDVASIYVKDTRVGTSTTLPAVRVWNGTVLPSLGLTVATARPMYVWGNYNQTNAANLNTTNTITTRPASLVSDAVTILSPAWTDPEGSMTLSSRNPAASTTVNAAIITGAVYTTAASYSGGMENFPCFLEDWSFATNTYNGSMVKMFACVYATNDWAGANIYKPPTRQWSFDPNFATPSLLPPLTPSLQTITRHQWATLAASQTAATNTPW